MSNKHDAADAFIKSIVERDPNKRRVKLNQRALTDLENFNFYEDNSSDDSDFLINKDADDNASRSDARSTHDEDEFSSVGSNSVSSSSDEEQANDLEHKKLSSLSDLSSMDIDEIVDTVHICGICLQELHTLSNALLECGHCHVMIHEGCNSGSDNHARLRVPSCAFPDTAVVSPVKQHLPASPWFCDACSAGLPLNSRTCDLCPNPGGILKQTATGRWVHLLCALYINGVAFGEVTRLRSVTLFEMSYTRWGAKQCSLCEDVRLARTGVCVQCDAGMCRHYFHVTCAHRLGLLEEVHRSDDACADPYYAHCRFHSNKVMSNKRKQNFNLYNLYIAKKLESVGGAVGGSKNSHLAAAKLKYSRKHSSLDVWYPSMKLARCITSSVYLGRTLLRKQQLETGEQRVSNMDYLMKNFKQNDSTRRSFPVPAFNVDFIAYFHERGEKIARLNEEITQIAHTNKSLVRQIVALKTRKVQILSKALLCRRSRDCLNTQIDVLLRVFERVHSLCRDYTPSPTTVSPTSTAADSNRKLNSQGGIAGRKRKKRRGDHLRKMNKTT